MRIASSSLAGFIFPSQSAPNGEKMRNGVSSLPPSARFPLWEEAFNGCKPLGSIFPFSQTHVDSEVCPRLPPNWPPQQEEAVFLWLPSCFWHVSESLGGWGSCQRGTPPNTPLGLEDGAHQTSSPPLPHGCRRVSAGSFPARGHVFQMFRKSNP